MVFARGDANGTKYDYVKNCANNPKIYEWYLPGGDANGTNAGTGGWDLNQYYSYAAAKAAVDAETRSTTNVDKAGAPGED